MREQKQLGNKIAIIFLIIFFGGILLFSSIMAIIEENTLPQFTQQDIVITELEVPVYDTKVLSAHIETDINNMERFDNHRESEINNYMKNLANIFINNPQHFDIIITITDHDKVQNIVNNRKNDSRREVIIYTSYLVWNQQYEIYECETTRDVEYLIYHDLPLSSNKKEGDYFNKSPSFV